MAGKKTTKAELEEAPKMKPYSKMTKKEMEALFKAGNLDQDVLEDYFPE